VDGHRPHGKDRVQALSGQSRGAAKNGRVANADRLSIWFDSLILELNHLSLPTPMEVL
jgi:hypothetical protein